MNGTTDNLDENECNAAIKSSDAEYSPPTELFDKGR